MSVYHRVDTKIRYHWWCPSNFQVVTAFDHHFPWRTDIWHHLTRWNEKSYPNIFFRNKDLRWSKPSKNVGKPMISEHDLRSCWGLHIVSLLVATSDSAVQVKDRLPFSWKVTLLNFTGGILQFVRCQPLEIPSYSLAIKHCNQTLQFGNHHVSTGKWDLNR